MSQDEIRKLLGGYATGTLTEAERKALFAAALDDQELFDELAREQSLKELLELPGARTRLAAALAPPPAALPAAAWWKKPLPWALAGTLMAGLVVMFALLRRPHMEIAGLTTTPQSESRVSVVQSAKPEDSEPPAPPPVPSPKLAANQPDKSRRDSAGPAPPPAPVQQAAPPPAPPKEEALKKDEAANLDSKKLDSKKEDKRLKDEKDALAAPAQEKAQLAQSQTAFGGFGGGGRQQAGISNGAAPANAPPAPPIPVRAMVPFRASAPAGIAGTLPTSPFAFDYVLRRDSLSVRPLVTGFLLVTDLLSSGQQLTLQPSTRLELGTTVAIAVPPGSATLTVDFTAKAPSRELINSLADSLAVQGTPKTAFKAKAAPVSRETKGRVAESPPTPDPHASIILVVPSE